MSRPSSFSESMESIVSRLRYLAKKASEKTDSRVIRMERELVELKTEKVKLTLKVIELEKQLRQKGIK